ncbi:SlyX family protein [Oceanisphaera arctica]|uniref:Protein SlyX homolog n=1 Tax=Oceanisphaera arctica TaxID=641510 RepID=A0A2P5TJ75_9GAMM|nr:SlyX family protein [Oceanisphaera arctica]PPL14892.1 lysis protein [Oceanisphaera arctica]GHA29575.1 hypothetical protein GCM10007082_31950 [Oceanisphaera arctica]
MNEDILHRLEQLETRLAFQDDTIEQLNLEVTTLSADNARLKSQLSLMVKKLKELQPGEVAPEAEETPPPHY